MAGGEKVPDDFVGVVMSVVDGVTVFSGPGDVLPEGSSLKAPDNEGLSPAEQVAAISAKAKDDDAPAAKKTAAKKS